MKPSRLGLTLALALPALAGIARAQEVASFQVPAQPQVYPAAQAPAQTQAAAPKALLQLKGETEVVGATVTIGDLVASASPIPADLAAIPVASAPAFNTSRPVSRASVESILLGHPEFAGFSLVGGDACLVGRPGRAVQPTEIPAVLLPEIKRATQGEGDVRIEEISRIEGGLIPAGRIGAQVTLVDGALNHPWASATVRYFSAKGELVGTSTVSYRWSLQRTAYVALRPLSPGEAYNPIDFRETAVDGIKLVGNALTKLPDAGDLSIARLTTTGTILTAPMLTGRKVVHKGESVQVTYNQNHVRISMKAVSLQDGAKGDTVAVKNPNSQRTIYAKVVGDQELEIQ
ncbi:MAG TPA: flagellar basal body P-ring formation chaperone FlgA [Candidatus Methylacidiphilales bacterium]